MGRALIVSAGASSNEYIAARLAEMGYARPVILPSGAEARRRMPDADFDLIVVNAPLPDEFGHELCMDAVAGTDAGVVFLVKAAQAEQLLAPLNEQGVLLLSKPFSNTLFVQAMHMAAASNHRLQRLRQENARLQEKIAQSEQTGKSIGLGNISRRIGMLYPDGAMKIYSRPGHGTVVRFEIPQQVRQEVADSHEV